MLLYSCGRIGAFELSFSYVSFSTVLCIGCFASTVFDWNHGSTGALMITVLQGCQALRQHHELVATCQSSITGHHCLSSFAIAVIVLRGRRCTKNPGFMLENCRESCNACDPAATTALTALSGDRARLATPSHALRPTRRLVPRP
jgi:hypothetical protein